MTFGTSNPWFAARSRRAGRRGYWMRATRSLGAPKGRPIGASRSYRVSGSGLAHLTFVGLVFWLLALIALAWIILIPVVLILGIIPVPDPLTMVEGAGIGLMFLLPLWGTGRMVITMPIAITFDEEERNVWFLNWFRRRCVPADAFLSIRTGGWRDPNGAYVEIRHQGGKLTIFNQYRDFRDFLERLKALNPSVEINGF